MNRLLIILFITVVVKSKSFLEPCGQPSGCYCSGPILYLITCTNITVFPIFSELVRTGVQYIDLYKTDIVGLAKFTENHWPSLNYLNLKNNLNLDCNNVVKLQRNGVTIVTDCDLTMVTGEISTTYSSVNETPVIEDDERETNDTGWVFPTIFGFASLFAILSVIGECMRQYKATIYGPVKQTTNAECLHIPINRETQV